jgi:hypothetical protein
MAKITLYDTAPNILGSFDKSLVKYVYLHIHFTEIPRYLLVVYRYTESMFRRDGISILTRHHVERVEAVRDFFLK